MDKSATKSVTKQTTEEKALETKPDASPTPLDQVVKQIATDSLQSPREYLKETVVPGGGE